MSAQFNPTENNSPGATTEAPHDPNIAHHPDNEHTGTPYYPYTGHGPDDVIKLGTHAHDPLLMPLHKIM